MSCKQRATTGCFRGRTGPLSRLSEEGVPLDSILRVAEAEERPMRAVTRQERFSSEADSESVFLFAEDVKEARSEFLLTIAMSSSLCRVSPLFSKA
jgi:hypothetical protein